MILGKDIVILNDTGNAVIAAAKSCELTIQADTIEKASASQGRWKNYTAGRKGWNVNINHLVMSIVRCAQLVGSQLNIMLSINGSNGLPFDGFINNPTVEQVGLAFTPDEILWDTTRNQFVAMKRWGLSVADKYYTTWSTGDNYLTPSAYAAFNYNGQTYTWLGSSLTKERLSGSVIVTSWHPVGTVGSLAQGSMTLLGNGALTPATL